VDSYLESDGELTLRMVEMGSVKARAAELGRAEGRSTSAPADTAPGHQPSATGAYPSARTDDAEAGPIVRPGTMIVPVDAWNKMLNQLGNLHEAGQQLAEARERAAKAETEAKFLRERLAEMREAPSYQTPDTGSGHPTVPPIEERGDAEERSDDAGGPTPETTTFWRYVVRGWRGRRT